MCQSTLTLYCSTVYMEYRYTSTVFENCTLIDLSLVPTENRTNQNPCSLQNSTDRLYGTVTVTRTYKCAIPQGWVCHTKQQRRNITQLCHVCLLRNGRVSNAATWRIVIIVVNTTRTSRTTAIVILVRIRLFCSQRIAGLEPILWDMSRCYIIKFNYNEHVLPRSIIIMAGKQLNGTDWHNSWICVATRPAV